MAFHHLLKPPRLHGRAVREGVQRGTFATAKFVPVADEGACAPQNSRLRFFAEHPWLRSSPFDAGLPFYKIFEEKSLDTSWRT